MSFWISVTSKDHVLESLDGGFVQAQGDKAEPLHLLAKDDVIFFYSPGTLFRRGEILQAFTAAARVTDTAAYEVKKGRSTPAWRRNVKRLPSAESPAAPLVPELDFVSDKEQWAAAMGRGLFAIGEADAGRIAAAMQVAL